MKKKKKIQIMTEVSLDKTNIEQQLDKNIENKNKIEKNLDKNIENKKNIEIRLDERIQEKNNIEILFDKVIKRELEQFNKKIETLKVEYGVL